ncbi:Imm70 family immunity protein, partial [Vibrio vulnificus]
MAVGIKVGCITDEIGTSDFFHAFFSTVSANLEVNGWGTRFPILMGKLYQGRLEPNFADIAIMELRQIHRELCCSRFQIISATFMERCRRGS